MIAIGVRYVCGWAVAADPDGGPEWPPHPARLFMALAAAHFETVSEPPTSEELAERRVLEWLEAQSAPHIYASPAEHGALVTTFVPVNDVEISSRTDPTTASAEVAKQAVKILPDRRSRQPREFARSVPHEDVVWFIWPVDGGLAAELLDALARLCDKVTRIGHSSSLVQVWLESDANRVPPPNYVPDSKTPTSRLRVALPGLLAELEARFAASVRPEVTANQPYGPPAVMTSVPHSIFSPELFIFQLRPSTGERFRKLGLEDTQAVIGYFRRAVIATARDPVPSYISGHEPDGRPAVAPHMAFLPLAFVGDRHGDGGIRGLAIALPRTLGEAERQRCLEAVLPLVSRPDDGKPGHLRMGTLGRWRIEPVITELPLKTLRAETWTKPAQCWASVTPVVFDRYTRDLREKQAVVADACERVGLPRPVEVRLSHISPLDGVPPSPAFGGLRKPRERSIRPFSHAVLVFDRDVEGPVLVGAGRYLGYGLFRQLESRGRYA